LDGRWRSVGDVDDDRPATNPAGTVQVGGTGAARCGCDAARLAAWTLAPKLRRSVCRLAPGRLRLLPVGRAWRALQDAPELRVLHGLVAHARFGRAAGHRHGHEAKHGLHRDAD